jgi:hypothetical protein
MSSRGLEAADVFRRYGETYCQQRGQTLSTTQRHAIRAIELCRTTALGGHVEHCDNWAQECIAYDLCSNRNRPKWQSLARAQMPADRRKELIDTQYFPESGCGFPTLRGWRRKCRLDAMIL